jgi:homogentisate phytyltransferase/homogentisate geranylgeranyltransferase
MQKILSLWRFSRPHTIIGSSISVFCLFTFSALTLKTMGAQTDYYGVTSYVFTESDVYLFAATLIAALACNVFITGLNQITDIEIDRINKPHLPLASGEISSAEAKKWVVLALVTALSISFYLSNFFGVLITLISFLGWSYSAPPIRFKRYHIWAASAIALVRGPLVNVGIALHFLTKMGHNTYFANLGIANTLLFPTQFFEVGAWMIPLTLFISAFSLGIAWFKDLPDTAGDAEHEVGTLAVKKGRALALRLGVSVVGLAYVFLIFWGIYFSWGIPFLAYHFIALGIFAYWAYRTNLDATLSLKRFYKLYWVLFFLEYFSFFLIWVP